MRALFLACVTALSLPVAAPAFGAPLSPQDRFRLAYDPKLAARGSYLLAYRWPRVSYVIVNARGGADQFGPIRFPPEPPTVGASLPVASPATDVPAPPAELAAFLGESFYTALSMRLTASDPAQQPTDTQRATLDLYREDKAALQAELLATIDTLRDAAAAARLRALADFAVRQTPRIVRLESAAEQLRRDLAPAGLRLNFDAFATVPDLAAWPAGVLRAAAFLQEGLSPDQRRLLREAAAEAAAKSSPPTAEGASGALVFFAPEPARVRLPAMVPAVLASRLAVYAGEKTALKRELAPALAISDPSVRALALAGLAEKQAPRFAGLAAAAEAIRRDWAAVSDPAQPPDLPQVPPELEARIVAYRREKLDLQKSLLARVDEVQRAASAAEAPPQVQERTRRAIAAFTQENAARYAALDRSKEAIRGDLARLAATAAPAAASAPADALLQRFSAAMQQWQTWRNYHYYQIAVLQPGLSPEQRRLLFDTALGRLALPLPEGVVPSN